MLNYEFVSSRIQLPPYVSLRKLQERPTTFVVNLTKESILDERNIELLTAYLLGASAKMIVYDLISLPLRKASETAATILKITQDYTDLEIRFSGLPMNKIKKRSDIVSTISLRFLILF